MNPIVFRFVAVFLCFGTLYSAQLPDLSKVPDPISGSDHLMADQLASTIASSEWLGVMAPVALSPFFGITCLAGMSQFGAEMMGTNSFISSNPILNNPMVFWIFLGLTIMTSLPRLTKVSKPMAQAVDQLEAYSGIVTLLVIRFMATQGAETGVADPVVMQMGFMSFTGDMLMSIAAIINIFVINTVKFFFEILVWLVPFPFVDALLELGNKTVCAGLMAIYAYSPTIATVLNLLIFVACLFAFFWIRRRVIYARTMLWDPFWATINSSHGIPKKPELIVFPKTAFADFPAKTKLRMEPIEGGWRFTNFLPFMHGKSVEVSNENSGTVKPGMLMNQLHLAGPDSCAFNFSKRYSDQLPDLVEKMNLDLSETESEVSVTELEMG